MEENPKPRRRWFRFSLRTMLVLVTLACVSLVYGRAMIWKQQRQEFLKSQIVIGLFETNTLVPIWLRHVGDEGYASICIKNASEARIEEAMRLFPEATLVIFSCVGGKHKIIEPTITAPTSHPRP